MGELIFFLFLVTFVLLACIISIGAAGRWLMGMGVGGVGYSLLLDSLAAQNMGYSTSLVVLLAGAILGSLTALSVRLRPEDGRLLVGSICLMGSLIVMVAYSLDFWSTLHWEPITKAIDAEAWLPRIMTSSLPGLLWSQLLFLRAVCLIREGKGWRTPAGQRRSGHNQSRPGPSGHSPSPRRI